MFKGLIRSVSLRRRVSWIVAGILILPFLVFFHMSGRTPPAGPGGVAGTIFGKEISWDTFQTQRFWIQRQMEIRLGGPVPELLADYITQSAWDRLIILEEATRRQLDVGDEELAVFIHERPEFQVNGSFSSERYHTLLRGIGTTAQEFEARLRHDLLIQKLLDAVQQAVVITDDEVRAAFEEAHESLKASVIVVEPRAFAAEAAAAMTEETLRAHYEAHPDAVRIPEQLVIEYAGRTREELLPEIQPNEEDLAAFYESRVEEFSDADGNPEPFEEILERVRERFIDVRVGERLTDFALDLEDHLDDRLRFVEILLVRGLMAKTTGPIPINQLVAPDGPEPAVLQALAGLPEGEMSEVIETDHGVYLARVIQRIPPRLPPFDEVRQQVTAQFIEARTADAARQAAEALRARLTEQREAGVRFEEAVVLEGIQPLPVQFTRTQPIGPLGDLPAVNQAAFTTPLGELTEVLDTSGGFVMVRPEERIPADAAQFAEAEAGLRETLVEQRRSARVQEWLAQLRALAQVQSFVDAQPVGPPSP